MINYINTINLPKTLFPMRANLVKNEISILNYWNKNNLYNKIRISKKGKKKFILHDGPPYANGNIHIGHAINKILKDIIIKSKSFMGYDCPYIPGWDCHGLPIELQVEKLFNKKKFFLNKFDFRNKCRLYAYNQIQKQKKEFIRLGIIGDWDNPYLTMDYKIEANIIRLFGKIINNNYIYRGYKPVHWCINCSSSLAESEVIYKTSISDSIYVSFKSINPKNIFKLFKISYINKKDILIIIWTTTPWSLPDNQAISVHPNIKYELLFSNNNYYIISSNLKFNVMNNIGINKWKSLGSIYGKKLEFLKFKHPFMNYNVIVTLSKHIDLNIGTGIIHIAPSHGIDDFNIALKYNLKIKNNINKNGCYINGTFKLLDYINIFKANNIILNILLTKKSLLYKTTIIHSYPYCWRHNNKLFFLSTPQWFINIENKELKQKVINSIESINWIPLYNKKRITQMLINRNDWCISRQRIWGVPITLFIHNNTYQLHPKTMEFIKIIAKNIEKKGIEYWWNLNIHNFLGKESCFYTKVNDILDVWFDSGSTFYSVVKKRKELLKNKNINSNLYLEGSDQHRGWFMSSIIISSIIYEKPPCKQILTHGFSVDNNGLKMSKSKGNVISPNYVINKYGSDILRLWVASNDYTNDVNISNTILDRSIDIYRRIRNTSRFILANLYKFNPKVDIINYNNMIIIDQWVVKKIIKYQKKIIDLYNKYYFNDLLKLIVNFCSIEMGSFYFEIIKDRQYTFKINSKFRKSCQTVLYYIIESLVRWIAPILSFTAHEIWNFIPGKRSQFIFTEYWYDKLPDIKNYKLKYNIDWNIIIKIRIEVNKIIELYKKNKIIKSSLEAEIKLYVDDVIFNKLLLLNDELHFIFIVSKVIIKKIKYADLNSIKSCLIPNFNISCTKTKGVKCIRCWFYTNKKIINNNHPNICDRCIINITPGIGEKRIFV